MYEFYFKTYVYYLEFLGVVYYKTDRNANYLVKHYITQTNCRLTMLSLHEFKLSINVEFLNCFTSFERGLIVNVLILQLFSYLNTFNNFTIIYQMYSVILLYYVGVIENLTFYLAIELIICIVFF